MVDAQSTAPSDVPSEMFSGRDQLRDRPVAVVEVDLRLVVDVPEAGEVVVTPACLFPVPEHAAAENANATTSVASATLDSHRWGSTGTF